MILIDAGPLVAMAMPNEPAHAAVLRTLAEHRPLIISTWPVLAEAAWLLRKRPSSVREMLLAFTTGIFELRHLDHGSLPWISTFLQKYEDIGAQLADASLMYVAEHEKIDTIFTLDRRDFSIYRTSRNRALKIVP